MRLLDTQTLQLSEFFEDSVPEYAILSHTWDRDEVTYRHIQSLDVARGMQGFAKVEGACRLAAREGFKYIWIDTCCIDKSSSAELSEAINSMYSWYQKSTKCYAYLADVNHFDFPDDTTEFEQSRWHTRGWTLQELIAPRQVIFHSRDWTRLGTKLELREMISTITGIDISILAGADHHFVSVARKMFWASRRQTTRSEDMAYCLLGLFSVNMPLLYGEGKNAFFRLQKKIIKLYDDQSIFAWSLPAEETSPQQLYGLLAESPVAFKDTGNTISLFAIKHPGRQPTRITSTGLDIELFMQPPSYFFGLMQSSRARWYAWAPDGYPILIVALGLISLIVFRKAFDNILSLIQLSFDFLELLLSFLFPESPLISKLNCILIAIAVMIATAIRDTAWSTNFLKTWSRGGNDNYYLVALDCQSTDRYERLQMRPCLNIVALEPRNPADYSSFARINVSKLEKEDLSSHLAPLTFRKGTSSKPSGIWALLLFVDTCFMVLEALMSERIPWGFRKVSVSHRPKENVPLGFRLLRNTGTIRVIQGYPPRQWHNHDRILRRKSWTVNDTLSSLAVPAATEEVIAVADGVIQLQGYGLPLFTSESRFPRLQRNLHTTWDVCLILGMRYVYQPASRDWLQVPWCRFVQKSSDETLDSFMYITDGERSTKTRSEFGEEFRAEIKELDNSGLYNVEIRGYFMKKHEVKRGNIISIV